MSYVFYKINFQWISVWPRVWQIVFKHNCKRKNPNKTEKKIDRLYSIKKICCMTDTFMRIKKWSTREEITWKSHTQ